MYQCNLLLHFLWLVPLVTDLFRSEMAVSEMAVSDNKKPLKSYDFRGLDFAVWLGDPGDFGVITFNALIYKDLEK